MNNAIEFRGRNLCIATMHHKEKVISPILEQMLGVKCTVPHPFDSDQFGTFSGEIDRVDSPLITARKKCLHAMKLNNCDLGMASEGSFGPHPTVGFIPANDELILLIDLRNKIEIVVREITVDTNFNQLQISSMSELFDFMRRAKFPSHALILRKSKDDYVDLVKGIVDNNELFESFKQLHSKTGSVFVETDMRAHLNPTRMDTIKKAVTKLVAKIKCHCPICLCPGFGIYEIKNGLPCENCKFPTKSTLKHLYKCMKCEYSKEEIFPNKKKFENPMYCDICNP